MERSASISETSAIGDGQSAIDRPSPMAVSYAHALLWPAIGAAVLTALMVAVFWDVLARQVEWAITEQADWGHTLIIPFIAGYFVYRNRDKLLATGFRTTWSGLVLIVLGVGWYILTVVGPQAIWHHNLRFAGFGLALFGIALLFFGFGAMRWLWFALAYFIVFGQTISRVLMDMVTFKMQDIAARGSEILFMIMGMDVTREGNNISLFFGGEEHALNIAEACSGMRMLMAFMALGVAMAYTGLSYNWQRVLLVALGVPIAIFVNMLRVVTLGFLSIFDTEFAAGDFHTFVGLVWLIPAFLLFLGAMWIVKRLVVEDRSASNEEREPTGSASRQRTGHGSHFDRRAPIALVLVCLTLLGSGIGFRAAVHQLNIYLRKEPVHLRAEFTSIPRTLGEWRGEPDKLFDAAIVESLGTDVYFDRDYIRPATSDGERAALVNVHMAYYTRMIDAVPHVPDRCLLAGGFQPMTRPEVIALEVDRSGWREDQEHANLRSGEPYSIVDYQHPVTGRPITVRMPIGDLRLRTTEFRHTRDMDARYFAGFFFIANGHATPYPTAVRTLAFDRTDRYAYYCKVQFFARGDRNFDRDAFISQVNDLLSELLPEIMRCLPDWAEVEAMQQPSASAHDSLVD